jgi:hypothetical protein
MESRRPLHQSDDGKGRMVSHRSIVDLSRLPLLPFERELVATLGCSEAEYRAFTVEAMKRSRVRPAEYDHIPDINAEVVTAIVAGTAAATAAKSATTVFLVNLAVGLALSAISFLLTPKPKQPGQTSSRQLASITGADRFSATSGFDTQAELANYGDPIPIIFGQYTGETGGILAAPSLVWSRAFSYGSQQGVKLLFVVGEQGLGEGINRPDLNGIFLGNTALDAIYQHNFAFYWKRNTNTTGRIRASAGNLAYGTRGTPSSGDPQTPDDVFLCRTIEGGTQPGFCQVYTPSANVQFGAYSAVPNGTDYRVNWRLVPIPHIPKEPNRNADDRKDQRLLERVKIAGDYDLFATAGPTSNIAVRKEAQKGTGRGYGRHMGITSLNGQPVTTGETEVRQVAVEDTAIFSIAPGNLPDNLYYRIYPDGKVIESTQVDDINSQITAGRRGADELLQLGETIMIGRTVWVVQGRSVPAWDIDLRQDITLRCIETFGGGVGASIGLISERMLDRGVYSDDLGKSDARKGLGLHAGPGFFPLLRIAFGFVRNTRECEVTEIGIRSQVWNRANGLCNFAGLPSISAFRAAEIDGIGIESGTMTLYMKRTSVWTIWLRPAGTDKEGNEYAWAPLGGQFCITGESPQDQFNSIRITHPQRGRYEFQMVPNSGADVSRQSSDDAVFWRLNAKTRETLENGYKTEYGTFIVSVVGERVTKKQIEFNPEMLSNATISDGSITASAPNSVTVSTYLPDVEGTEARAVKLGFGGRFLTNSPSNLGGKAATMYELFGLASSEGLVRTAERTVTFGSAGRAMTIRFTGIVNERFRADHPTFPGQLAWNFKSVDGTVTSGNGGYDVASSTGGFNTGQIFNVVIPVTPGNPRAQPFSPMTSCGLVMSVVRTSEGQPRGRESTWDHEIFGSAQSFPIGHQASLPIEVTSSEGGTATVTANATVSTRDPGTLALFPGQTQAWDVKYVIDPTSAVGAWSVNTGAEATRVISSNNPFSTSPGDVTGVRFRVASVETVATPPGVSAERVFEENSQINDISFYDSLLTKSNESGPEHEIVYVNESVSNPTAPQYSSLTIAGLALKASRNFTSLNQLRVWLGDGISVRKFQLNAANEIAPSNKFTDLVYYLLTDKTAGAGNIVSPELIDTDKLPATSQFLKQNKLFFDGAIDQPTNVRQFISDLAPFFLCNFVIINGRFSIIPAVPTDSTGLISNAPVQIQQLFTSGNIIENTFSVEYLSTEERKSFQAVVRYRTAQRNQFPEEQTLVVRWSDLPESTTVETFDMTQYCTSRQHAFMAAKYFLSLRRRVTHTIKLRTTPYGLSLAPGDYIRVLTQASPYNAANNGVVDSSLNITSVTPLLDGVYTVSYWNASFDDLLTETMTVADGKAVEAKFADAIFTIADATVSSGTYMVEQLTLGEEGLVDIVAVEFPTTSTLNSLIALDLLNDAAFTTEG